MNYVKQLDREGQQRPFLFSYRRCPYAIRARMALIACEIDFDIYEISLKDKPKQMLELSLKGTVPVFIYNEMVLDESLDIMNWAKEQKKNTLIEINPADERLVKKIIEANDGEFKNKLDLYKYTSNKDITLKIKYRKDCEIYIKSLNEKLETQEYLLSNKFGYLDIAIFPFIRQFFNVDLKWFESNPYKSLKNWVERISDSELFNQSMQKPDS
ncbi:MAG: glutathione S-transferase [Nitrosomonadales bacterium]|nr:glutathione S-transferase [Nitrosomonadales bacterium]